MMLMAVFYFAGCSLFAYERAYLLSLACALLGLVFAAAGLHTPTSLGH